MESSTKHLTPPPSQSNGAGATLESLIDAKFTHLLARCEAADTDGNYRMNNAELTKALEAASKWVSIKRKIDEDEGYGTALGGRNGRGS